MGSSLAGIPPACIRSEPLLDPLASTGTRMRTGRPRALRLTMSVVVWAATGTKGRRMSRDELADLNENWAAWLRFTADHAAGGESPTFGAIRCSSVGVPMPLFNQAFVFAEPAVHDLER